MGRRTTKRLLCIRRLWMAQRTIKRLLCMRDGADVSTEWSIPRARGVERLEYNFWHRTARRVLEPQHRLELDLGRRGVRYKHRPISRPRAGVSSDSACKLGRPLVRRDKYVFIPATQDAINTSPIVCAMHDMSSHSHGKCDECACSILHVSHMRRRLFYCGPWTHPC